MEQHNNSEKPLFDNGNSGQELESLGVDAKENQWVTASGKKVTEDELLALQEKTLERHRQGEAVDEEEEDEELAEVEDIEDLEMDEFRFEREETERENEEGWDEEGRPTFYKDPGETPDPNFSESLDHRYDKAEYYLTEAVDWAAIEADPKQLFTVGNSKVAADTIIYNLQPARFCPSFENGMCKIVKKDPKTGEFKIACYAYQDERQYDVALQLRLRQMRFWDTHTAEEIFRKLVEFYKLVSGGAMVYPVGKGAKTATAHRDARKAVHLGIKSRKLKYIRFNQSGDLKDVDDAKKMDELARLAKEEVVDLGKNKKAALQLDSYTYTARKDILHDYKFKHVHVQGSGFNAITAINQEVEGGRGVKSIGKTFAAFPSLRDKKGEWMKRDPLVKKYYEDIFEKLLPDGTPNPNFDKYMKINTSGWYACPGDCNSCPACKVDKFKNIAAKIHRSFQRISTDWHNIEKVGKEGYRIHQKFDPYVRDKKGKPLKWSQEMEDDYDIRVQRLKAQDEFSTSSKKEKEKTATETLSNEYEKFDIEMNDIEGWQKRVKKWEDKVKKHKLNVPIAKLRARYGVPDNRYITQLRKEDIDKYATEEEKNFLKESE